MRCDTQTGEGECSRQSEFGKCASIIGMTLTNITKLDHVRCTRRGCFAPAVIHLLYPTEIEFVVQGENLESGVEVPVFRHPGQRREIRKCQRGARTKEVWRRGLLMVVEGGAQTAFQIDHKFGAISPSGASRSMPRRFLLAYGVFWSAIVVLRFREFERKEWYL